VFAAWIFMSFLQNRYSAAFQLYRELIQQCREGQMSYNREGNVREQVLLFKRRFELMRLATNFGLVAAILLITTLIGGIIDVVIPSLSFVPPVNSMRCLGLSSGDRSRSAGDQRKFDDTPRGRRRVARRPRSCTKHRPIARTNRSSPSGLACPHWVSADAGNYAGEGLTVIAAAALS
jgi:Protein of unknown function (DUF2721)